MSDRATALDMRAGHASIVRDVLRAYLPEGAQVFVFGSRAHGGARRYSDLDLALEWERPLGLRIIGEIAEALSESDPTRSISSTWRWSTLASGRGSPQTAFHSIRQRREGEMAGIKVRDLAYGRLRAPDLDAEEEFLTAFGMVRAARTPTALYMRGTDPVHHIHVTEKGDPKCLGFAWAVSNEDLLKAAAKLPGASGIESIDEPGGGKRVRLTEPNGYTIEIVHGIETAAPIHVTRQAINSGVEPLKRAGEVIRFAAGPSSVKRIGHAVLGSPKNQETVRWFREMLGLVCSDDVFAGEKDNIIGQFSRIDAGDEYVDHHAFFCMRNERAGLNHFSFEVQDIDDVFIGHEYLSGLSKYEHMWGIGRHLLGSQVYDYWADPWGRVHEHWADTDRLNVRNGGNLVPAEEGLRSQWGTRPPEKFRGHVSP